MPFELPSTFATEEWFKRLRALILNVIEIALLLFAAWEIVKTHIVPVMTPLPVQVAPAHSRGGAAGACLPLPLRRDNEVVRHRRSIDLMAPVRRNPVEWPDESRRPQRQWQRMTDGELRRVGEYLRQQVEAGHTVHQQDLDAARAEWRRRHPRA
jgi:hypothetical protein